MRINIVLSLFLFSSLAYSQNKSLPTVIKGLEHQLEQAQKERSTIKQKLDAAFDSHDQTGANQAKVNELMDQDRKIKELNEKIANLKSKETSAESVSQKSSAPKGFKSLEEATQQRSLLATRIAQTNAPQAQKDEWRKELEGIDSAIEDFKAKDEDELAPILPIKDSGFQLKKIKLETCKWDTKQPKRIIQAPGCSIAGTKICIGYVECESSSPDSPNMTRMSTCSEENCNNASECTKEGGYGSTEYRESIDSPKKLPKKSAVKKE